MSTQSTRNNIEKMKEIIRTALDFKREGNMKKYREQINKCTFIKANCEARPLRLWVKAFLESLDEIVVKHKDQDLIDLLLYKLPWLCHGLKQGVKVSSLKSQASGLYYDDAMSVA